ncbi:ImmA/IrrE family metallo-endopeptidase [Streptococcus sobrinus]|uniref:ImmA/IrrE family metallo-endopeptidase n=1 Tax=Streptococcus sobrinus TaxID=1310 RepID=UPI0002EB2058|nr:ImmA/IrrE family metallo-endopeptidase [Streptococcus sobrinus]
MKENNWRIRVMEEIKYKDLFPEDFWSEELSGISTEEISKIQQITLNKDEFSINLDEILEILGIKKVAKEYVSHSGQINRDEKMIYINPMERKVRQRFTVAHEIGHYALNHEGISNRLIDPNFTSTIEMMKERSANQFAAELLMPKRLILKCIEKFKKDNGLTDEELKNANVRYFVEQLSNMMETSKQATQYRLQNLKVINYS